MLDKSRESIGRNKYPSVTHLCGRRAQRVGSLSLLVSSFSQPSVIMLSHYDRDMLAKLLFIWGDGGSQATVAGRAGVLADNSLVPQQLPAG